MTEYHLLSLGAGVQSTTLYLLFLQGEFRPQIHSAIFADTGDEPQAVYRHLDWLRSLGGPPILIRSRGCLGDDLIRQPNPKRKRVAAIPSFIKLPDGRVSRTQRQCTREYKIDVIERTIRRDVLGLQPRRTVPRGVKVYQYIGISLDEAARATRLWERYVTRQTPFEPRFPLIARGMTRPDCQAWLQERVPHTVPRSACVYCPFHSDREWLEIAAVPQDWARAVQIDEALRTPGLVVNRNMKAPMYLHRSCQPLTQVDFAPRPERHKHLQMGFELECMGACGL